VIDLLQRTAELVAVNSVSRNEAALATMVEASLRRAPHLTVTRVGDNVVAQTAGGSAGRILIAGHLDTVPGDPEAAVLSEDRLVGLGASDMKASLALMEALALELETPSRPLTWVFYAREEIARSESGLVELAQVPGLLDAEVALLLEPTALAVEAGCQGTLRLEVTVGGVRAHSARPFMGRNAIHRLAPILQAVADYRPRVVLLDGCEYAEQLQVVGITGGVSANVVPDRATATLNARFAPDRSLEEATAEVERLVEGFLDPELGDRFEVVDGAPGALPGLGHPLVAELVERTGQAPRAKVGWTDVATFAARGLVATNFGPGDPLLAHHPDEAVDRASLEAAWAILADLLA